MDSNDWNAPSMEIKLETGSKFDAPDWPSSSCVKINVKQETESLCPEELQHSSVEVEEPTLTLVKSEYEVQENYWVSSRNPIENDAEERDDNYDDYDDDYYDNDNDDNNDVDYEHDDVGDLSDMDDGEKDYADPKDSAKNNKRRKKNLTVIKDTPTFYQKRRHFFEAYIIRFCPFCGDEFTSHYMWKAHTETEHNFNMKDCGNYTYLDNLKAKCNQCSDIVIRSSGNLKTHMLAHLPYTKIFKCKLCTVATTKNSLMIKHIELRHFDVVGKGLTPLMEQKPHHSCAYCGKYVGDEIVLSNHIQYEHAEIYEHKLLHVCPACGEQFETDLCHKKHLENQHQFHTLAGLSIEMVEQQPQQVDATQKDKQMFRCLRCNHIFHGNTALYRLRDHAFTHETYKRFKCRYCDFDKPKKTNVITHTCNSLLMDLKSKPKFAFIRNAKDISKELRPRKSTLITDASDKLYVCPSCGENFDDQVSWDRHLTHAHNFHKFEALNIRTESSADGIIKCFCTLCDKKFNTCNRNNIRVHAFYHMPHKIYKCKLCQASLNSMVTCFCKKSNVKTGA